MADLTQTTANVRATSTTQTIRVTAGESVEAGDWVYKLAADGEYYGASSGSAVLANVRGMVMTAGGADGTIIEVAVSGDVNTGATGTIGAPAFLSANVGKMKEDLPTSGQWTTILGGHTTASNFRISILALGVARA